MIYNGDLSIISKHFPHLSKRDLEDHIKESVGLSLKRSLTRKEVSINESSTNEMED